MYRKAIACFFFVVFLVFAALQINDPDPVIWASAYMVAALLTGLSVYDLVPRYLAWLGITAYLSMAVILWPATYSGVAGTMEGRPEVELARESLGLLICAFGLAVVTLLKRR